MNRKILVQIPRNQVDHFFTRSALEELQKLGEVVWNPHDRPFTSQELQEQIRGIHIVITTWKSAAISDEVLQSADSLELIAHMAGSIRPIVPTMQVYERGIRVLNSNYAIAVSVSESVIAFILALGHKMIEVDQAIKSGIAWKNPNMETYELRGRTVGLVGLGMVAKEVIKLLQPFGVRILGYDPFMPAHKAKELNVELKSLNEVLSESEIISLHAPKIPETFHMIGANELALIRDGAIFINTARGDLIDQEALVEELQKQRFCAGLDVFVVEPLPTDNKLRVMNNVIARPHLAGVNPDSKLRIGTMMVAEMKRYYSGEHLAFEVKQEQLANMT